MTSSTIKRFRPSPALVVSFAALFVAMSGAAMALPGQDTVNSGDIVNETIKSVDLKNGAAVSGDDVIDNSLLSDDVGLDALVAQDLAANSVESSELADNSVGSTEIADNAVGSTEIANDAVGSSEIADDSVSSSELGDGILPRYNSVLVNGGTGENGAYVFETVTASCQAGEELISGSGEWTGDAAGDELFISEVILNHNAETVTVRGGNDSGDDATLFAAAHCL